MIVLVSVHPCDEEDNGGCEETCVKKGMTAECTCPKGYTLAEDKKACNKTHPCDLESNGGCMHICTKKGEIARCLCNEGFNLAADKESCIRGKSSDSTC